jgi:flagellar biosynthetic protein FlhB
MANESAADRTEKATPKRKEKALEEGQVALSQEVNSALVLAMAFSLLFVFAPFMGNILNDNARYLFSQSHIFLVDNPLALVDIASANFTVIIKALAPLMGIVMVTGFLANVLQVGWHVNIQSLAFKWSKINPISGIKQMFAKKAAFELLKNVLKIAIITTMAWWTISGMLSQVSGSALLSLASVTSLGKLVMMKLVYRMVALLTILAALDWSFQKWQHEEDLKMTKQELKEEAKDLEGDPQVKARMRAIQYDLVRRRMMADVPTADVVVTNPTHFAVALKYVAGDPAPKVVAKGADHVAQKIKALARDSRVPVIENVPLARALHKSVDVGSFIPDELYKAVAEVLAYIYRLKRA